MAKCGGYRYRAEIVDQRYPFSQVKDANVLVFLAPGSQCRLQAAGAPGECYRHRADLAGIDAGASCKPGMK
jgi:hypothetical protein